MPIDLSKMISEIQKGSTEIDQKLKKLYGEYGDLYTEANRQFIGERSASGNMSGLEEFYRMVQTIRRNRDVMGSLVRGVINLRSLKEFKVIEEDIPDLEKKIKKEKKVKKEEPVPSPIFSGKEKQQMDKFIDANSPATAVIEGGNNG